MIGSVKLFVLLAVGALSFASFNDAAMDESQSEIFNDETDDEPQYGTKMGLGQECRDIKIAKLTQVPTCPECIEKEKEELLKSQDDCERCCTDHHYDYPIFENYDCYCKDLKEPETPPPLDHGYPYWLLE